MTSNQLAYWRNVETNRSNLAQEAETKRHNVEAERIGMAQVGASYAATAAQRAAIASNERIAAMNLEETRRYHDMSVASTNRGQTLSFVSAMYGSDTSYASNMARTQETQRHNMALESSEAARNSSSAFKNYTDAAATLVRAVMGTTAAKATSPKH